MAACSRFCVHSYNTVDVLQLLSAAEDSFVRVWHLTMTPESNTVEVPTPLVSVILRVRVREHKPAYSRVQ